MTRELSIPGAIARLGEMAAAATAAGHAAMVTACELVQAEARRGIERDPVGAGPPVADTEHDDGIGFAVSEEGAAAARGIVGSNSDGAVCLELGTSRMPPRPFLAVAAIRAAEDVTAVLGRAVADALVGRPVSGRR